MASNKYYPHQIGLKSKPPSLGSFKARSVEEKSSDAAAVTQPFTTSSVSVEEEATTPHRDKPASGAVALTIDPPGAATREERKRRYQQYVDTLEPPSGCCAACVRTHRRLKKMNGGYPMWPIYLVVALFVPAFLYFIWYAAIK